MRFVWTGRVRTIVKGVEVKYNAVVTVVREDIITLQTRVAFAALRHL